MIENTPCEEAYTASHFPVANRRIARRIWSADYKAMPMEGQIYRQKGNSMFVNYVRLDCTSCRTLTALQKRIARNCFNLFTITL
jgi:hypothetical protein